jgi:cobaltochelatase CobN
MHILAGDIRSLDDTVQAVDLGQTPADLVVLSFTDSDLALVADAAAALGPDAPGLRLASLAALRHPYSVDLYVEQVAAKARFVLVRCLGGLDYWRYGVEQLALAARARGFDLAVLPGDNRPDPRLDAASTVDADTLARLGGWFRDAGPATVRAAVAFLARRLGRDVDVPPAEAMPAFGCLSGACGCGGDCRLASDRAPGEAPRALVVAYRAVVAAADDAPVRALAGALGDRGFDVLPVYVTSLKDAAATGPLAAAIARFRPEVILNTTAFSARRGDGGTVLDAAGVPVIQAVVASTFRAARDAGTRGLSAADLAMNVVLPEVDGRLVGPVISYKDGDRRSDAYEFTRVAHRPDPDGTDRAADLAAAWVRLARTARANRRVAVVLSDYPAKGGRTGYAVGLDGPASLSAIAADLAAAGYRVDDLPDPLALIRRLEQGGDGPALSLADYRRLSATLDPAFLASVVAVHGDPADDAALAEGAFRFRAIVAGHLVVAVQPDRGRRETRADDHHDATRPPSHGYVAFYLWLRHVRAVHAMVHLGTHGTLEWLPGKATALSASCAPAALVGDLPVVYPFIVNNPAEAAQARRRLSALTLGHLTPPLTRAGSHGATADIEAMLDEFAEAQALDPRRANALADAILARAAETGLSAETGLAPDLDRADALARLDAFVCDLKDMRIGDGLHVFGRTPEPARVAATAEACGVAFDDLSALVARSAAGERDGLVAALDGRFVPPGPSGAPAQGRLDVLPTGRSLYAVDPRAVPTRTACEIGARVAEDIVTTYAQDHGVYPKRIVLDLWASTTMRTGGDDLGQAFALIGVRPTWDPATSRVTGFEIRPTALLGRPRVDVTLRISGLFRDVFQTQIALFDAAARAVAERDEDPEDNPLRADADGPRVFGAAPGTYGIGVGARLDADDFADAADLGATYLAATSHAFEGDGARPAADAFRRRVENADAFVHVQDMAGQDILDSDAFAEHEGGFAAAAGGRAALYHVDATAAAPRVRRLADEVARVVRGRATNPRWLAGQMRHGHRGAAEIAETVRNLVAFAATAGVVRASQFEALFDATLGDERVLAFLVESNPAAATAVARSFDQALRRGLWQTRRNSVAGRIAETLERAA